MSVVFGLSDRWIHLSDDQFKNENLNVTIRTLSSNNYRLRLINERTQLSIIIDQ